ncbi:MAG: hypothetical protein QOI47_2236, partial [Actinomycetota bacterium]|nr:hypothetical protein [Actinomycetota bacterium]
ELYHVADDFSETVDLAAKEPEKLQELIDLWWVEAERFQVLPLNNTPGRDRDTRHRFDRYVYFPGIGSLTEVLAPNLKNRAFQIVAELDVTEGADPDGVVVAQGSSSGGYAVYIKDRRLHYVHNLLGASIVDVGSSVELPVGRTMARVVFTPTGRFQGDVELLYDSLPVGEGHVARTTPISFGMTGFTVGHQRGAPVCDAYEAPFAIDHDVLRRVVIDGLGAAYRDVAAEERVALAQQ